MNYAAHNQELHGTLKRPDEPVIFTKADSAILNQGKPFFIPDHLGRIDYETEVVVRICRLGKNIPERFAHRYYDALTVGIDFTARDLQKKASEAGQPWTICKGFDGSAAIGEWVPKEKFLDIQRIHFHPSANGCRRRSSSISSASTSIWISTGRPFRRVVPRICSIGWMRSSPISHSSLR